jgi:hypothetical protein
MFSVGVLGAVRSDDSEFANDDVPAGSAVLSCGVAVGVDGAGLSSATLVGVDGAGRASAELDIELHPAKEFEYVFKLRFCTSRSVLQACSKKWSYLHIHYNQVYPEFRGSNHHENVPLQCHVALITHNESCLFLMPSNSPQQI